MISLQSLSIKSALLAPALLFFAMAPAASAPVQVGIAATVVGDVRMSNATTKKAVKIPRRQRLAWGDQLTTRKKSKLQILLLDRSSLTIGSNARLTIDRFVYDPGKERSLTATVSKGAFRFMSGRKSKKSSASVSSSVGTIGIRGTALDGVVGKEAVAIAKKEPFLDGVKGDKENRDAGSADSCGLSPPAGRATDWSVQALGKRPVEIAGRARTGSRQCRQKRFSESFDTGGNHWRGCRAIVTRRRQ
jgi:hypothetical protein